MDYILKQTSTATLITAALRIIIRNDEMMSYAADGDMGDELHQQYMTELRDIGEELFSRDDIPYEVWDADEIAEFAEAIVEGEEIEVADGSE